MAWEKHGARTYYYRSVRQDGRVRKLYYGAGAVGKIAAEVDALRRAEQAAAETSRREHRNQLDAAMGLTQKLNRECDVLTAAELLAAGFHRPSRHSWRIWRNGRKAIARNA
jgi:hypothetical protein